MIINSIIFQAESGSETRPATNSQQQENRLLTTKLDHSNKTATPTTGTSGTNTPHQTTKKRTEKFGKSKTTSVTHKPITQFNVDDDKSSPYAFDFEEDSRAERQGETQVPPQPLFRKSNTTTNTTPLKGEWVFYFADFCLSSFCRFSLESGFLRYSLTFFLIF